MKQPIEKNLLQTFRFFLLMRLMLTLFSLAFQLQPLEYLRDTLANTTITVIVLVYLYLRPLQTWLGRLYLPIAVSIVSMHLLIEQRLIQFRTTQLDLSLERDLLRILEAFTSSSVENTAIPLLFTLATTTFLFVPLVLISWQYRFRAVLVYILFITLFDIASIAFFGQYVQFNLPVEGFSIVVRNVASLLVGYIVTRIMQTQRAQKEELASVNRQLAAYATTREQLFVTQERNRLARELHDTLAHTMSAVTVKLNAVGILWQKDPQRAEKMLNEVIVTLSDGNDETRRALRDLRASPLDDMCLVLAIRNLAESAAQRGNFALDLQTPTRDIRFSPHIEQAIYRIAQESLANVVEHAEASHVSVVMDRYNTDIKLTIRDNGNGFVQDITPVQHTEGHFGLLGMQERASMINGTLLIESQKQVGTSVSLTVETTL
ncbi:MAG: sensor histidine kinase [Chloroflexota bacterium]